MNHRRFFTFAALEPRTLMASISGMLWNDLDKSQTYDPDNGEAPFAGWTVFLDTNGNGRIDGREATTTTNSDGVYSFANLPGGTYNVAVAPPTSSFGQTSPGRFGSSEGAFDIKFNFNDDTPANVRAIFQEAAARWKSIIIRDLPSFTSEDGTVIDDLLIDVDISRIDGQGGTLGQAAPTENRAVGHLTARGFMQFDPPDVESGIRDGSFSRVVLHEMGHVLGVGTIWPRLGLLQGAGGKEPRFIGTAATVAYQDLYKVNDNKGVPVEAEGGPGTALGHWDEETFDEELMTGYTLGMPFLPLSKITVGSMQDMGYGVNLNAFDKWDPLAGTGSYLTPDQLGAIAFQRQVNLTNRDNKRNVDFGYRTNRAPKLLTFTAPSRAAIGQNVTLSASNILDADGDAIASVSFYRESNGVAGLQKGQDVFIGSKTTGKRGAFTIETSTDGLSVGDQVYYAIATDTQLTSDRRSAVVSLVTMPDRPEAPAVVSGVSTSGSVAFVNWVDSAVNEEGYRVQVATRSDFASDAIVTEYKVPADTMSLKITGLLPGKRYYYRVRGFNIGGSGAYTAATSPVQQLGATEILVDNAQATFNGNWTTSTDGTGYFGDDYRVNTSGRGSAVYSFEAVRSREYALYVRWPASAANAKSISLTVMNDGDAETIIINQAQRGNGWVYVGSFDLKAGAGAVVIDANGAKGNVVADAIRFL